MAKLCQYLFDNPTKLLIRALSIRLYGWAVSREASGVVSDRRPSCRSGCENRTGSCSFFGIAPLNSAASKILLLLFTAQRQEIENVHHVVQPKDDKE
jgi:hypothetical protein